MLCAVVCRVWPASPNSWLPRTILPGFHETELRSSPSVEMADSRIHQAVLSRQHPAASGRSWQNLQIPILSTFFLTKEIDSTVKLRPGMNFDLATGRIVKGGACTFSPSQRTSQEYLTSQLAQFNIQLVFPIMAPWLGCCERYCDERCNNHNIGEW